MSFSQIYLSASTVLILLLTTINANATANIWSESSQESSNIQSNYVTIENCQQLQKSLGSQYATKYYESIFESDVLSKNTPSSFSLELTILNKIKSPQGNNLSANKKIQILKQARCLAIIDDIALNILQTSVKIEEQKGQYRDDQKQTLPRTSQPLIQYLQKKKIITDYLVSLNVKSPSPVAFPLKQFPTSLGDSQKISIRERIYAIYSPEEMMSLAKIMQFAISVADAKKVSTTIEFNAENTNNFVIQHSASDIYRLAFRIFEMKKKEFSQQIGYAPSNLEVLAATIEMGFLPEEYVSILTQDPSFYKKDTPLYKKVGGYLLRVGLGAAQLHPLTAPYAIVALILYSSYQELQEQGEHVEIENFYFN